MPATFVVTLMSILREWIGWKLFINNLIQIFHAQFSCSIVCFSNADFKVTVFVYFNNWMNPNTKIQNKKFTVLLNSGVSKMMSITRSYVRWQLIDNQLEGVTRNFSDCLQTRNLPTEFIDGVKMGEV